MKFEKYELRFIRFKHCKTTLKIKIKSTSQKSVIYYQTIKGIVHFEIHVLAYLKGIQDVGVCPKQTRFVS